MMTAKKMVFAALDALGDVSYNKAHFWIVERFEKSVSYKAFHHARKEWKDEEVVFSELVLVNSLLKEVGGKEQLAKILAVLDKETPKDDEKATVSELFLVNSLLKEVRGKERLAKIIAVLDELRCR